SRKPGIDADAAAPESLLRRRRGLGHQPVEITPVAALDRQHQDRRRGIGMHLLYRCADLLGERGAGLDDHHHLLAALERALPPIMRDHAGQNIHAGTQPPLDQRAAGLFRLDNRGVGRIDEDRALHIPTRLAGRERRPPAVASRTMSPALPKNPRIHFVASPIAEAQEALKRLIARYGDVPADASDVIVALGGDGLMLQTLHRFMKSGKPIYGMHRGTVGFLMNEYAPDD